MSALPVEMTHCLYRLFDATGALLYVGITSGDPTRRFSHHRYNQPWWPEVASYTVEWHATGDEVAAAEARAIEQECPKYNVRPGKPVDVRRFRRPGVGKKPMVKRTFYIKESIWEEAKSLAAQDPRLSGANISDIVRELVEDYVRRGGKR